MTNNDLLNQLIKARQQAKKEGVNAYGEKAMLQIYPEHALLENSYKFKLKGLNLPGEGLSLSLPLQKFLRVLRAAKRISPNYKIELEPPYKLYIQGETLTTKFSICIPYISHTF